MIVNKSNNNNVTINIKDRDLKLKKYNFYYRKYFLTAKVILILLFGLKLTIFVGYLIDNRSNNNNVTINNAYCDLIL